MFTKVKRQHVQRSHWCKLTRIYHLFILFYEVFVKFCYVSRECPSYVYFCNMNSSKTGSPVVCGFIASQSAYIMLHIMTNIFIKHENIYIIII